MMEKTLQRNTKKTVYFYSLKIFEEPFVQQKRLVDDKNI